ncbi:hypothetical protein N9137_00710, partial [Pseudomonadales bacterium]|nr:hypothetical protein [Pseudomonadales bacterium]
NNNEKCSLQESSSAMAAKVWLGIDDANPIVLVEGKGWQPYHIPEDVILTTRMHLTQEDAKLLIERLQVFVDTGGLEL